MDFGSLDFNVGAEGMAKQDQKKKKKYVNHTWRLERTDL